MRLAILLLCCALALSACGGDDSVDDRTGRPAADAAERGSSSVLLSGAGRLAPRVTVVAVGDIACKVGGEVTARTCRHRATASRAWRLDPDAILALGDLQYERGNLTSFRQVYDRSWGKLRGITWAIPGNHEYRIPGARGFYRYFADRPPEPPGYYRRSINTWQIYLLNSNCDQVDCPAQRTWLYRQMYRHPSKCSLIALHHPRYSSGRHGNQREAVGFWRIALRFGADVAVAGHDHDYERFAPMDNAGNVTADGIQSFVVGTGGKNLYPRGEHVLGSRVFRNDRHGVLRLSLRPNGWTWQFHDISGRILDRGYRACR